MKTCSRCKLSKDESEFYPMRSRGPGKLLAHCILCAAEKCRSYAQTERAKESNRRRAKVAYAANPGPQIEASKERNRLHPEIARNQRIKKKYGLTPDSWAALFASQGGCCAVCGRIPKKPSVDHNHVTGKVRGILCEQCNIAIGLLQDSSEIAFAAGNYLAAHS